jgi:hypothetical protein
MGRLRRDSDQGVSVFGRERSCWHNESTVLRGRCDSAPLTYHKTGLKAYVQTNMID